jgi:hypothetical protein
LLSADLIERCQECSLFRLSKLTRQGVVHDPCVEDRGTVDKRSPGIGEGDNYGAPIRFYPAAPDETALGQAGDEAAERGLAEGHGIKERTHPYVLIGVDPEIKQHIEFMDRESTFASQFRAQPS